MAFDDGDIFGIPVGPEFMKAIREAFGGKSKDPIQSENPEDYPESVVIQDLDVLAKIMEYEKYLERTALLRNELDEVMMLAKAKMKNIYRTLDRLYPDMASLGDLNDKQSGLRKWKGKMYFIAWYPTQTRNDDLHGQGPLPPDGNVH